MAAKSFRVTSASSVKVPAGPRKPTERELGDGIDVTARESYPVPVALPSGTAAVGQRPYVERIVDQALRTGLAHFAGMLMTGPRAGGKTRTGLELAASDLRLDDPDDSNLCKADPMGAVKGKPPYSSTSGRWFLKFYRP